MPGLISTLDGLGMNNFNRKESYSFPVTQEFPLSAMNQTLPEKGVAFEKTTLDFLEVGQSMASKGFVTGATGWQINGVGDAEFNNVTIRGTIYATLGEIGGWSIDSTRIYSTNIDIDSDNEWIRSTDYVSGTFGKGFSISSALVEAENIRARGLIRSAVFQKDVISAIGGSMVILEADVLSEDMNSIG